MANGARQKLADAPRRNANVEHARTENPTRPVQYSPSVDHIHRLETEREAENCTFPGPAASFGPRRRFTLGFTGTRLYQRRGAWRLSQERRLGTIQEQSASAGFSSRGAAS